MLNNIITSAGIISIVKSLGYNTINLLVYNTYYGVINGISLLTLYNNSNVSLKYSEELELLDVEFKLKTLKEWLKNNDTNCDILNSCNMISYYFEAINTKIKYHKSKWFYYWRNLCLKNEIHLLKKHLIILDERLKLLHYKVM